MILNTRHAERVGQRLRPPPVADKGSKGWRSGRNCAALQAAKQFRAPQEGLRSNFKSFYFSFFLTLFLTFFEMHLETTWFQGFLLARFRSAHGLKIRIFMLNLSVNFSSVANRSQQFRLLHHQYSINQHRVFLSYFPFSLFTATQILTAEV